MVNNSQEGLTIYIPQRKLPEAMAPDDIMAELDRLLNDDLTKGNIRMSHLAVELGSRYEAPIENLLTPETKTKLQRMLNKVGSLRKEHPSNGSLESLEISLHEMLKSQGVSGEATEKSSFHEKVLALLAGLFT